MGVVAVLLLLRQCGRGLADVVSSRYVAQGALASVRAFRRAFSKAQRLAPLARGLARHKRLPIDRS